MSEMSDIKDIIGESKIIKVYGKIYHVVPCTMGELPVLQELFEEFEGIKSDTLEDEALTIFAKIIQHGVRNENKEKINIGYI